MFLIEDSPVPGKTFLFLVVASSDLVLFPEPLCGVKAGVNSHVPTNLTSEPLTVSEVLSYDLKLQVPSDVLTSVLLSCVGVA